ncbi:MAG: response regulator [Chloroflexota bacterium]
MNEKQTILLLNNDNMLIAPLREALCRQGYDVLTAHSSCQALSTLCQTGIDLLIIDSEMADMKGVDFLHHLRQNNRFATLPVLMLVEEALVASPVTC